MYSHARSRKYACMIARREDLPTPAAGPAPGDEINEGELAPDGQQTAIATRERSASPGRARASAARPARRHRRRAHAASTPAWSRVVAIGSPRILDRAASPPV